MGNWPFAGSIASADLPANCFMGPYPHVYLNTLQELAAPFLRMDGNLCAYGDNDVDRVSDEPPSDANVCSCTAGQKGTQTSCCIERSRFRLEHDFRIERKLGKCLGFDCTFCATASMQAVCF